MLYREAREDSDKIVEVMQEPVKAQVGEQNPVEAFSKETEDNRCVARPKQRQALVASACEVPPGCFDRRQ